jgi:uncharacterized protein YjiS (DUF1127 family)
MRSQTWNEIVHRRARNTLVLALASALWTAGKWLWTMHRGWAERTRQRRALALLSDHNLRDIGLTRAETLREARRPFWREGD